ncbi:MAG: VWA domain-containing protein [Rhizobiales bacterium]|nr:VWA domain-containing protein [Hyphomicrobiales bacterium]
MRHTSTLKQQARRFWRETAGSAAIIFGVMAVPVTMGIGAAVDLIRSNDARAELQRALDAGTLAAASSSNLPDAEREEIARQTFAVNIDPRRKFNITPTVSITGDTVSMSVDTDYATSYLRVAGIDTMNIGTSVTVNLRQRKKAEIALVLDYSGPMNELEKTQHGHKAVRNVAIQMVDDMTAQGTNDRVKFGLIQFSMQEPKSPAVHPISQDRGAVVLQQVAANGQSGDVADHEDDATMKFVVLLTDGRQFAPSLSPDGSRTLAYGDNNLEQLCAYAKARNVTFVTVGFDVQDQVTQDRLRNCSSDPERFFFIADDGAELVSSFEEIKNQLLKAIYIAK